MIYWVYSNYYVFLFKSNFIYKLHPTKYLTNTKCNLGKYLNDVDRVMTQVDRITEDIDHMPVAAFIFRDQESDEVHFSPEIRLT